MFRIRIHPDPKLIGIMDQDPNPKLLVSDLILLRISSPFSHRTLKYVSKMYRTVLKSKQIHHTFIHNILKILKVQDFNPFVYRQVV